MMGRICLGLSLPLLLGAAQPEAPKGWETITSKEGKFKVLMPATPLEKKQNVKTATGQLTVKMLVADGKHDSNFVVSYTDYADSDVKKGPIEKRLDQARDGAVSSAGGKLKGEHVIKLKTGQSGRHFLIEKDGELIARMRIYFVNRRLYQVMVLGNAPEEDAKIFLASFALNE